MNANRMRVTALITLGVFLMQAAWILAVPPFRGIDEFDHAFRASAVASGQWLPSEHDAVHGRGNLQAVERSIVTAAEPICESYKYTGPDNCNPVESVDDKTVIVATAAGRYHPLFYWIIGSSAEPAQGADALYVMRLVTAGFCAAFIGFAVWTTSLWAKSRWPLLGIVIALSPVAIYSTSVAAPNGVEIAAALSLWAALLGLVRTDAHSTTARLLIYSALPGAVVVSTVRQLGPLFLVLVISVVLISYGRERFLDLLRAHPVPLASLGTAIAVTSLANLWWVKAAAGLTFDEGEWEGNPAIESFKQVPAWLFQTIAAFPTRNEQAPTIVYAIWLLTFSFLVIVALRGRWSKFTTALLAAFGIGAILPIALSIVTFSDHGPIWQGRYGLPFTVGIPLIAGLLLDTRRRHPRFTYVTARVLLITLILAHAVSVQAVLSAELETSPLTGDPAWFIGHPWVPASLMVVGGLLLGQSAWSYRAPDSQVPCEPPTVAVRSRSSSDHSRQL